MVYMHTLFPCPAATKIFFSDQRGLSAIRSPDFINGKGGYLQVQHIGKKKKSNSAVNA